MTGVKITFNEGVIPGQVNYRPSVFNSQQHSVVLQEIASLVSKGVLIESQHEPGEFISTIFLRPKSDGSFRLILNLKELNESVEHHHFKMDTLDTVVRMMKPGCYMASVDLKDAYYTVPVHEEHQKFLKFVFNGCLYQFTCLPNGLSSAPRIFTKLLKPAYSTLHNQGHLSIGYIDDSYLQGDTLTECKRNVEDTSALFTKLGFTIHPRKSVFTPAQTLTFLGFVLNSLDMTVTPTQEKVEKTISACSQLLERGEVSILDVARVIGIIVSNFPGVQFGPLHYRALEHDKTKALASRAGNFQANMTLSAASVRELEWWISNIPFAKKLISHPPPTVVIQSDASKKGWGAVCNGSKIGGRWTPSEASRHINVLELQAAFFGLKSFAAQATSTHTQLQLDNSTAVAYINNMGGSKSSELDHLAHEIWDWAIHQDSWISAVHIPGTTNLEADEQSRNFSDKHEWALNNHVFKDIFSVYQELNLDLFASRLNNKLSKFCSWKPDPDCAHVDAFSINWSSYHFYAFPPFSLIPRCLQKVIQDRAKGVLVVPLWPTQSWFPLLLQQLYQQPWILLPDKSLLQHPTTAQPHPLWEQLKLMVCPISGIPSESTAFLETLPTSSWHPGDRVPQNNIKLILKSGLPFVVKGRLITIRHKSGMP